MLFDVDVPFVVMELAIDGRCRKAAAVGDGTMGERKGGNDARREEDVELRYRLLRDATCESEYESGTVIAGVCDEMTVKRNGQGLTSNWTGAAHRRLYCFH